MEAQGCCRASPGTERRERPLTSSPPVSGWPLPGVVFLGGSVVRGRGSSQESALEVGEQWASTQETVTIAARSHPTHPGRSPQSSGGDRTFGESWTRRGWAACKEIALVQTGGGQDSHGRPPSPVALDGLYLLS